MKGMNQSVSKSLKTADCGVNMPNADGQRHFFVVISSCAFMGGLDNKIKGWYSKICYVRAAILTNRGILNKPDSVFLRCGNSTAH